ncbi:MAG: universal stress protein [Flavobacteriaceae bacterium]|nr:universal stress protein [Flavobacteriaceae bacterium]
MKNILVPVGASKNTLSHLQYAIDFAKDMGATVHVVHVFDVYSNTETMMKLDTILDKEGLVQLDELLSKVNTRGVQIHRRILQGKLIAALENVCETLKIDLILVQPRTTSFKDEVFLGKTSGKIIKQTQIPALIIPESYVYKPITRVLMAVKSALIKTQNALTPLQAIQNNYRAIVNLLLVKTSYYNEGDFKVNETLSTMITNTTKTENATIFQGVLEHFKSNDPDLLCVIRRHRGFFSKLWEKNVILKRDFYSSRPVLVLRGLH